MKRIMGFFALCAAICSLCAQTSDNAKLKVALSESWKLFLEVEPPQSFEGVPETLRSSGGGMRIPQIVKLKDGVIDLGKLSKTFKERSTAILYNEFVSDKSGMMRIGVSADWWLEVFVNGKLSFSTMKDGNGGNAFKPEDHVFDFPVRAGGNLLAVKVLSGSAGWRFACGAPVPPRPNVKFEANSEWKAVDLTAVQVKEGSALDLSGTSALPLELSGRLQRLGIGRSGKLVSMNRPENPVRLNGYTFSLNYKLSHEEIAKNVKLARLQGYNMFRYMDIDCYSYKREDLSIRPDWLDNFDYLISQMGEQGVYLYLNIFSYGLYRKYPWGADNKQDLRDVNDCKARMYLGDSSLRKAWKYGAETLMGHVNPYTGLAWKDEPVIACVEFYNEQEFGLTKLEELPLETRKAFEVRFRLWLEAKYKTPELLAKAWKDDSISSFAQVAIPKGIRETGANANDFLLLCGELSRDNAAWCEATLRETGYKGLTAQYNLPYGLGDVEAKFEKSQVTIGNTYFNHPSNQSNPGSRCGQDSSIGGSAGYWRWLTANRFADRPFFNTEHNHAFWNKYQHEGGLLFGAYSALQGIDAMVSHADAAVFTVDKPNDAWSVGRNPVARANDFLSACLYLRGDVKSSPHRIELEIPQAYLQSDCRSAKGVSMDQNRISLISGFTVTFPWAGRPDGVAMPAKPDLSMTPADGAEIKDGNWFVEAVESKNAKFSLDACLASMKAKGLLPESNISNPSAGVFQSDTGEITMRAKESLLKVVTPRCEGVSLEGGKGEPLGRLKVIGTSAAACVAACSVDGKELVDSRRVVLVYSTEVVNTDMELSSDRVTLVNLGKLPVLLKVGKMNCTLKNSNGAKMSLYALGFDGTRREKLPLAFAEGFLEINLDTASLKDGPTNFFELVAE